jgi:hypothetical protein
MGTCPSRASGRKGSVDRTILVEINVPVDLEYLTEEYNEDRMSEVVAWIKANTTLPWRPGPAASGNGAEIQLDLGEVSFSKRTPDLIKRERLLIKLRWG